MGFSPSNKLVAWDLMTAPFTFVCLNSVNSNFSFSSSCKVSSFKSCSNLRIFAASCVSFLSFCFFLCDEYDIVSPLISISSVSRKSWSLILNCRSLSGILCKFVAL